MGQKGLLRDKRDKTRPFGTKGQKGHLFSPVFFPGRAWSLAWSTYVWLTENKSWLALVKLNYNYILFEILVLTKMYNLSK